MGAEKATATNTLIRTRMKRSIGTPHTDSMAVLMRLMEFSDSTLPTGGFSFSCGLETAVAGGLVFDAATLEEYLRDAVRQSQHTDLIAMLHARRACLAGDYESLLAADSAAWLCKLNDELRTMTSRMGRKLGELAVQISGDATARRWTADIAAGRTHGTYAAAQGSVFGACGADERQAAVSLLYGAASVILGAALRCMRVSHIDTQRILWRLAGDAGRMYDEVSGATLDNIENFSPQLDILAAMHEKGTSRMFMN